MSYKFLRVNDGVEPSFDPEIEMNIHESSDLESILRGFEFFLKACGFNIHGSLDIVEDINEDQLS